MNLPTLIDIKKNFILLIDVAKLKPGSTSTFDSTGDGLSKSFWLVPFLYPAFFFWMMNYTLSFDKDVSTTVIAYRSLIVYSTLWTLFPVVLYSRGFRDQLRQFVVARNWLLIANLVVLMIASIGGPLALLGLAAGLYVNVMDWFILKDVFKLSNGRAFLWFCVQLLVNSFVMLYYFFSVGIDFEKYIAATNAAAGG